MILVGIVMYFNSCVFIVWQSVEVVVNLQIVMMNKLVLYVFLFGVVVGGLFLLLVIILYWFLNNIWMFGQQYYVFGMIEKEEEVKKQEVVWCWVVNVLVLGVKFKWSLKIVLVINVVVLIEVGDIDDGVELDVSIE